MSETVESIGVVSEAVTVCVDAAGGDEPVSVVLDGIADALASDPTLNVVVTGPADDVEPFAAQHPGRVEAVACSQVIGMDEHPAMAVRQKRDSSIVVGCKLVKAGRAQGFFSAGSTGAVLTAATLFTGRVKGVDRPALSVVLPGPKPTVILDVGANADCKPQNIVQFAQMGRVYARVALGLDEPTVALLNIGSEPTKGSAAALACYEELSQKAEGFRGNAEGVDLLKGTYDVVVCDGFTGNIALKTIEGTAKYMMSEIKGKVSKSLPLKLAAAAMKPAFKEIAGSLSGDVYGGAVLLGIDGVVIIGHGATSREAVKNGTLCVARAVRSDLVGAIKRSVTEEQPETSERPEPSK